MKESDDFINRALRIAHCWQELSENEKDQISIEQIWEAFQQLTNDDPRRALLWNVIKTKAENTYLCTCHCLWSSLQCGHEKAELWDIILKKANTFDSCQWLWATLASESREKDEAWSLLQTMTPGESDY